ncbi:MAG: class I SAM-dependent methyltransferase [Anaerolineales bacterium]
MNLIDRLRFNLFYFGKAPWDTGISPPELLEFIQTHPTGRAIDIGCGTGTNIITLAKSGWQTTGFDFAPRAIQIAKQKLKKENIQASAFVDDASKMKNVKGTFDLALDMGCFHGIKNKADYLTQLSKILAPNGFWLMYGFFKQDPLLSGPGLVDSDIDMITTQGFTLISRRDGFDRHERTSAWFLYQNL